MAGFVVSSETLRAVTALGKPPVVSSETLRAVTALGKPSRPRRINVELDAKADELRRADTRVVNPHLVSDWRGDALFVQVVDADGNVLDAAYVDHPLVAVISFARYLRPPGRA